MNTSTNSELANGLKEPKVRPAPKSSAPTGEALAFTPIQNAKESERCWSAPRPLPASDLSVYALGFEAGRLWRRHSQLDAQVVADPEGRDNKRLRTEMEIIEERTNAIESQVAYMPAASLRDMMYMLALVHSNVDDMLAIALADDKSDGFNPHKHARCIDRMLCTMLRLLSRETGISLEEAGLCAYMKNTFMLHEGGMTGVEEQAAA